MLSCVVYYSAEEWDRRPRPVGTMRSPAPLNCHKWLVLSLLGLALSVHPIGCDKSTITEKFGAEAVARCNEKCPFQNRTGDGHFDLSCGADCSMEQCTLGCGLWRFGLENSCQTVCNVTSESTFSKELYCVMGCNEALNTYFQNLRELIGTPPAPALVADSLTATSLSLVWDAARRGNLSHLVQWRYEELPGAWQYYSNTSTHTHAHASIIHVDNLRPYTKYRFRVAIFLSGRGGPTEPIYSAPSVVISTLESGRPSSPPAALRAAAPDPSRVAISWQPGPFPNGPLVSYVLRLAETHPNTAMDLFILDMPASNNTLFYMFQNLVPAREYKVSVAMRNAVGEGPRAYVTVSTPPLPTMVHSQQPVLILGGEKNVLATPANDMLSDPVELYSTDYEITGIGLDITNDYLFVSVSNGYVYRSSLSTKGASEPILTPNPNSYKPLDLSVDWLNRHLYVLGQVNHTTEGLHWSNSTTKWEIIRCDFDGKNQLVAVSGFNSRPIHFEVDAYNGYLFWSVRGVERGGLYRLDLAAVSNGVRHDAPPELIVRDAHLGAFTVDHADFRLLVAHHARNTVLAVSLDGRDVTDFRSNTQTPMFLSVRSIAYASGLFYWTNGREMLTEEYHGQTDSYFHNEYPIFYNTKKISTRQVLVALRSCQPIPVPVNPPIGVQSVMGINRAKVAWSPPHLLGHQGSGAWQHWAYHLQLTDTATGETVDRKNINGSRYTVENLREDTEYVVKVAAVTESGSGPWSSEFVGKTLPSSLTTRQSTLLWSGPDGLLQTNLTGDNLRILIDKTYFKKFHITDISWYRDKLYLVTNISTVMWYNTTSTKYGLMSNMENVGSLAVDWVGKRIYWSNPKQQLITRGNLDGSNREPVPIVTVAKELTIDSVGAYIYWNTGHAVEAARLNGENKMVYYPAQLFNGKQVMGITADLEKKWLYWMVRSYDGSELHRAPTADQLTHGITEVRNTLVSRLPGAATLGPLCYYSGRLVWVQDAARAVVSDLRARHAAQLLASVLAVAVRDPALHERAESMIAIPETVNASSIAVAGQWDHFNVSWAPATRVNVNGSRVSYDVSVVFPPSIRIERTVEQPWVEVAGGSGAGPAPAPYSAGSVSVRAHSAWGAAAAARAPLRSPPAPPGPVRRARLYVQPTHSDGALSAVFRWEPPAQPNGVLRGYEVQCWVQPAVTNTTAATATAATTATTAFSPSALVQPPACAAASLPHAHTQLQLTDLEPRSVYYFKVRAYTDAGYGPYSETVSASSDVVEPIPRVLLSAQDSVRIADLDSGESVSIPKSSVTPVDVAVSIEENILYWVNNLDEIFLSRINGSGHYKLRVYVQLASLNSTASSLCVDWAARAVYWSQREAAPAPAPAPAHHVTYRAALPPAAPASPAARPRLSRLFATQLPLHNLIIDPLRGSLYWFEKTDPPNLGRIMTSKIDGSNMRPFFTSNEGETRRNCKCPESPQVAGTFALDMTGDDTKLFWVDPWLNKIIETDMQGCSCRAVVDGNNDRNKFGFTPTSVTVDSKYVYWFNSTEQTVYYTDKNATSDVKRMKLSHGYKILALDPATQPYPPRNCLYPKRQDLRPSAISNTANSITLKLPPVEKPDLCKDLGYEMSMTEYNVVYKLPGDDGAAACRGGSCRSVATTAAELSLNDLEPFTRYSVALHATNYYTKLDHQDPIEGSSLMFQTAAEAPTAPRNVTGVVLTPELARVEWAPEPGMYYELHWTTDDSSSPQQHFKEHNRIEVPRNGSGWALMSRLSAGTRYVAWVRARRPHSALHADSAALRLRTYPPPAPLALARVAPEYLHLLWPQPTAYRIHKYSVEYTEASEPNGAWRSCALAAGGRGEWTAAELRPRTRYRFRLRLQYVRGGPLYHWPADDRFTYETLGDVPGAPGPLRVEGVGGGLLRAWWADAEPRGAPVQEYRVWGKPHYNDEVNDNATRNISKETLERIPADVDDDMRKLILEEGWELLFNGSESYWLIGAQSDAGDDDNRDGDGAPTERWRTREYWCRVQARNAHGWGALSAPARLQPPAPPAPRAPPAALPAALAAVAALALLLVVVALALAYKSRSKKKALLEREAGAERPPRPDVELATLRQLPTAHSTNILYNQGLHCPTDAELAALPHIRREQITLTKFLGSGAFGEVFEGLARHIEPRVAHTKVAVKTLRKCATESEKAEFLKEAALMANFKHEHILRLVGVCLDNDPHYIIMELMEGGDLLTYLRANRPTPSRPHSLTLVDLLSMCVDVTKGCRYLEEMHFVHRDLACRNCLVARAPGAGAGPSSRVVKIGDFGLARDVYKNDYYRKEGEGLLPVRWMAVECLVDGVFTSQSDVWAWAVLCWEVLSLGQQPYPACSNRQVLEYVRAGGTPDRPPNCPALFYKLLQKCWSYSAEARPTFQQCLRVVTALRDATPPGRALSAAPAPPHDYLPLLADEGEAVDNRTYLLDENDNACLDEDFAQPPTEASRALPERTPKYLELMYESDSGGEGLVTADGYEVPRGGGGARHSVVGVAPLRLVRRSMAEPRGVRHSIAEPRGVRRSMVPPRVARAHSLRGASAGAGRGRARPRSATCTVTPLRRRASLALCDQYAAGAERDDAY